MFAIPRSPTTVSKMNPWEAHALTHNFPPKVSNADADQSSSHDACFQPRQDPLIYPGLYAPSGIDVMKVLFGVFDRPNPKFDLGPVDCSAALTICNLDMPGNPIIYANDAFSELTGYSIKEVMGRSHRFLQAPHKLYPSSDSLLERRSIAAIQRLEQAVASRSEIQVYITNYKKNGQRFINLMSMIPIRLPNDSVQYAIGFHVAAHS